MTDDQEDHIVAREGVGMLVCPDGHSYVASNYRDHRPCFDPLPCGKVGELIVVPTEAVVTWDTETIDRVMVGVGLEAARHGEIAPRLIAYRDGRVLFTVTIVDGRELARAILPLAVLANVYQSDAVSLVCSGRAWSTADPIPPVIAEGDLRQRVLILVAVDRTETMCRLLPLDPDGVGFVLGDPVDMPAVGGVVTRALRAAVVVPVDDGVTDSTRAAMLARCRDLGHTVEVL